MTNMLRVIRTNTDHICVDGKWFRGRDLANIAYWQVAFAGSTNPGFDMPPWFYSGSPYGDAILALGADEVDPPPQYRVEFVPRTKRGPYIWRKPAWPDIFDVE